MKTGIEIADESGDKKYFTIIPNYILNHSTMWDREVYVQMKRVAGENGTCWNSRATLAKQCGMSPRRLDKSLKYLIEHSWIEFVGKKAVNTKGGVQEMNEYRICDLWSRNNDFYQEKYKGVAPETTPIPKGVAREDQRGSTVVVKGVAHGAHKEEPLLIRTIEEELATLRVAVIDDVNEIIELFRIVNPTIDRYFSNTTQRASVRSLLKAVGRDQLVKIIDFLPRSNASQYAPTITTPYQLETKLAQLKAWRDRKMAERITEDENRVKIIKIS